MNSQFLQKLYINDFVKDSVQVFFCIYIHGFQCLHISSRTCNFYVINNVWKKKSRRAVGEKDAFHQNTLPQDAVALKKIFSKYHNVVTKEVVVVFLSFFGFYFLFCFYFFGRFFYSFC